MCLYANFPNNNDIIEIKDSLIDVWYETELAQTPVMSDARITTCNDLRFQKTHIKWFRVNGPTQLNWTQRACTDAGVNTSVSASI